MSLISELCVDAFLYEAWCVARRAPLHCGHNGRNVWSRAQTVMGPSPAPACHPALILTVILLSSITQLSSSQYVSIPSLTVSFLQSQYLYSIQRSLDLCIHYLIMVVVKDIGIHYYSAYSLCGGTNPKLYTHRLRLNTTTIDWGQAWEIDIHALTLDRGDMIRALYGCWSK